jgi:type II secretory pathway pseudopilin PulG
MSPTRNNSSAGALDSPGFTLVELLIGLVLAMFLTAAMLLSYTFIVRSLIRSSNQQQLEEQSRRALQMLSQDAHVATDVLSFSLSQDSSQITLRLPNGGSTVDVTYSYAYDTAAGSGTLTRTVVPGSRLTLLTGIARLPSAQNFLNCLDKQGLSVTTYPLGIKQIEVSGFTVTGGNPLTGTQSSYTGASARFVLRSKHLVNY